MTLVRILHLSDLHFRHVDSWSRDPVLGRLAGNVRIAVEHGLKPDFVAVTGDIAFSAAPKEYEIAYRWFCDYLIPAAGIEQSSLMLVPGNHDVDRRKRNIITTAIEERLLRAECQDEIQELLSHRDLREAMLVRHRSWLDFFGLFSTQASFPEVPWWSMVRVIRGVRIHFAGLTSAWMSGTDQDKGRLLVGLWQVRQVINERYEADLSIALMHHPWSYLADWDARPVESAIRNDCQVILRGHVHESGAQDVYTVKQHLLQLTSGACYETSRYPNAYQFIDLDPVAGTAVVHLRTWDRSGKWIPDRLTYPPDGARQFSLYPKRALPQRMSDL